MTTGAAQKIGEGGFSHRDHMQPSIVLACEHATNFIPKRLGNLGLDPDTLDQHIAWDIGALKLASCVGRLLRAPLVQSGASRLVYDCNRPPSAPDAIPAVSAGVTIPGNQNLTERDRLERVERFYEPFHCALAETIAAAEKPPALITIHSFTPVWHGVRRNVEIGVLHDADPRLAMALMENAGAMGDAVVRRNEPYASVDGVTHTLQRHGLRNGLPNAMLEVRNDLLETEDARADMAERLAGWITQSLDAMAVSKAAE